MKTLKKILLRYRGMIDIEIRVEEIANGYLVNNRYLPTKGEVQKEIMAIIEDPGILYQFRKD